MRFAGFSGDPIACTVGLQLPGTQWPPLPASPAPVRRASRSRSPWRSWALFTGYRAFPSSGWFIDLTNNGTVRASYDRGYDTCSGRRGFGLTGRGSWRGLPLSSRRAIACSNSPENGQCTASTSSCQKTAHAARSRDRKLPLSGGIGTARTHAPAAFCVLHDALGMMWTSRKIMLALSSGLLAKALADSEDSPAANRVTAGRHTPLAFWLSITSHRMSSTELNRHPQAPSLRA